MNASEFPLLLFSTETGDIRVNAVLRDRTLWRTQKTMAGLFGVKSQAITRHLKNIYAPPELTAASTCSKMNKFKMSADATSCARWYSIGSDFDRQIKLLLDANDDEKSSL